MKAHKNFGIAATIFMALTVFTGFHKATRKTHVVWALLMLICFIGAMVSGHKLVSPKKREVIDMTGNEEELETVG